MWYSYWMFLKIDYGYFNASYSSPVWAPLFFIPSCRLMGCIVGKEFNNSALSSIMPLFYHFVLIVQSKLIHFAVSNIMAFKVCTYNTRLKTHIYCIDRRHRTSLGTHELILWTLVKTIIFCYKLICKNVQIIDWLGLHIIK